MNRIAAVLICMCALGGCGGDGAPTTSPPPAPTPAPPAPPPPAPVPPGVPSGLGVSASGTDFIEWTWNAVEGADGYDVQFSPNEAFTNEDEVIARTGEKLSYRREGLPAGTSAYLRVRSAVGTGRDRITGDWSTEVRGMTDPPAFESAAAEFLFTCPTPSEIAAIDAELQIVFIDDPTAADPLACTESAGSVDLTEVQMGAYQSLRLMKAARFSEPLPWTQLSLWDWLVTTIDGIEFDSTVEFSHCCRGDNIVVSTAIEIDPSHPDGFRGPAWIHAYRDPEGVPVGGAAVGDIQLFVHEARHAEGPGHTCAGGSDETFGEMGAWAYAYYTWLWFEQKFVPPEFFSHEARLWMRDGWSSVCRLRICGDDCPG